MNASFELLEFSDSERAALRDAFHRGTVRAIDNRTDGRADCDGDGDARRIGERIADGFTLLNASHDG